MEENKDGGNGGLDKQPGQATPQLAEEKIMVLTISIGKISKRIEVDGLLGNKVLCFNAIGEAIKTIANFNPPSIIQPVGGMAGLARRFLHKR
jgi:hypothetical protein